MRKQADAECPERAVVDELRGQPHRCDGRDKQSNVVQSEKKERIRQKIAVPTGNEQSNRESCCDPDQEEEHDVDSELPSGAQFGVSVEEDRHLSGFTDTSLSAI